MALTSQLLNNNIFDGIYIKNIGNFGAVNIPKLNYNPIKFNYNVGNIENNSKIYVGFLQGDMTKPILIPDKKYIESLIKTSDTPVSIDLSNYYTKEELQNILDKLPVYDDYDSLKNKPIINRDLSDQESSNKLPDEYQEVDYIESNGNQWIVIDKEISTPLKVNVEYNVNSYQETKLFELKNTTNSTYTPVGFNTSKQIWCNYNGWFGSGSNYYTPNIKSTIIADFSNGNQNITLDGTVISSNTATIDYDYNRITLFAYWYSSSSVRPQDVMKGKIYSFSIEKDGVDFIRLIPCYRKSDGEVGLYDIINNQFYTNQGSGTFQYGRPLVKDSLDGYEQVDYIETSGTQYINTNHIFTADNQKLETQVKFVTAGGRWAGVFKFNVGNAISIATNGNKLWFGRNGDYYTTTTYNDGDLLNIKAIAINQNLTGYVNEQEVLNTSYSNTYTPPYNYYLFAQNYGDNNNSPWGMGKSIMYYFRLYENDVIIRNYIPMRRKSDNEIGMYDLVNNQFYTNAGSGSFIAGESLTESTISAFSSEDAIINNQVYRHIGNTTKTFTQYHLYLYDGTLWKDLLNIEADLSNYYTKEELQTTVDQSHNHTNKEILDTFEDTVEFETLESLEFETLETTDLDSIGIDSTVQENSENLITSGAVFNAFNEKIPTNVSAFVNDAGYLTEHQDISHLATNSRVEAIENKIPAQASSTNQLADKDFVNSSINSLSAFYITCNESGDAFATKADLLSGPYYSKGTIRTLTQNDYACVLSDETYNNATVRYVYDGAVWGFQYKVNDTPLTSEQLAAINSGITTNLVSQIHEHSNKEVLDQIEGVTSPETLDIDTVVTENSNNLITSGAVHNFVMQSLANNDIISRGVATIDDVDTSMFTTTG